jgi:hypothetical protein
MMLKASVSRMTHPKLPIGQSFQTRRMNSVCSHQPIPTTKTVVLVLDLCIGSENTREQGPAIGFHSRSGASSQLYTNREVNIKVVGPANPSTLNYLRSVHTYYDSGKVATNRLCDSSSCDKYVDGNVNEIKCETSDILYLVP